MAGFEQSLRFRATYADNKPVQELIDFLSQHFVFTAQVPGGIPLKDEREFIIEKLAQYNGRLEPAYLQIVAASLRMAAEFGFPSIARIPGLFQENLTDPLSLNGLIAITCYFAYATVKSQELDEAKARGITNGAPYSLAHTGLTSRLPEFNPELKQIEISPKRLATLGELVEAIKGFGIVQPVGLTTLYASLYTWLIRSKGNRLAISAELIKVWDMEDQLDPTTLESMLHVDLGYLSPPEAVILPAEA